MKFYYSFIFLLIGSCSHKNFEIFVHHESRLNETFHFTISQNGHEIIADSIQYSGGSPNFKSYSFQKGNGVLKMTFDTSAKEILLKEDVNYYLFFILKDSIKGKRIIVRTSKTKPVFE